MEHIREGKHGARSAKQAIAIGVSKARRAGVKLPPPKRGSARMKKQAARDSRKAGSRRKPSPTRSRAVRKALNREPRRAASHVALSRQARSAARRRLITRTTFSALPRSRTDRSWFEYRRDQKYPALFSGAPTLVSQNRSSRTSN